MMKSARTCRTILLLLILAHGTWLAAAEPSDEARVAQGVVFHDANGNGRRESQEMGLPGVKVSNGRDVTATDGQGRYQLSVDDDDIVFVIKPAGWRTPLDENNLPRFYYVHKPQGSPELKYPGVPPTGPLPAAIDFPLYPQREPQQFRAVLFGDPQPRNQQEVDYIAHDVVEELIGTDASFGVTLGDIVFDDLNVFQPLNQTIALIGIPWYNVIGNHDINFDAAHDGHSDETFERVYGPPYYSFDYGQVHFIVLDDIEWYIPDEGGKGRYRGGLGGDQLQFVRNDLAAIPADQLVVLLMHIPLVEVHDRQDLYRLIEKRPFCISISGHTHHHEHRFITREDGWQGPQPHHHIINVTVSGSWWSGAPDERGIPHTIMGDGAPNGYSILSFDGTDYTLDFKAAGRPAAYQMHVHAPEVVKLEELDQTPIYVNVFNGSERSQVEMRLGGAGDWTVMKQTAEVDPRYLQVAAAEEAIHGEVEKWRKLPKPKTCSHLWKATLPADAPAGTHLLRVRTTDMHGRTHAATRVIRLVP